MPLRLSGDGKIEINELLIGTSSSVSLPANTVIGNVDSTEIGYLDNVTNPIQTQLNTKANSASVQAQLDLKSNINSPAFIGTPTAPTAASGTNTTQISTTAYAFAAASSASANADTRALGYANSASANADTRALGYATSASANANAVANASLALKANLANPTFTGNVSASNVLVSNNLTVDTNTLVVDAANNRVGIGTASPLQPLHVVGNSFLNGSVILGREDAIQEGSQIAFARSTDNGAYWNLDVFGNSSTPSFRFHNEGTVKLNIDSSGRVTMPNQPMFHAFGNTTQAWSGTATMKTIQLNDVYNNIGSHFNTSTHIFTAPVAGTYIFFARAATTTATATGPALHVNVNNGAFAPEVAINYSNIAYTTFFGSMIRTLAANDNVRLSVTNYNNTSFTIDQSRCSLSGYLIG